MKILELTGRLILGLILSFIATKIVVGGAFLGIGFAMNAWWAFVIMLFAAPFLWGIAGAIGQFISKLAGGPKNRTTIGIVAILDTIIYFFNIADTGSYGKQVVFMTIFFAGGLIMGYLITLFTNPDEF